MRLVRGGASTSQRNPAHGYRVQQLEDVLGMRLFSRNTRVITQTHGRRPVEERPEIALPLELRVESLPAEAGQTADGLGDFIIGAALALRLVSLISKPRLGLFSRSIEAQPSCCTVKAFAGYRPSSGTFKTALGERPVLLAQQSAQHLKTEWLVLEPTVVWLQTSTDRNQSEADDSKGPPLAVSRPSPQTLIEPLNPRAA